MRLAFVVAEVAAQAVTYGTVYLAQAALRRGHEVAFVGVDELTLAPDGRVTALAVKPRAAGATNRALCDALARPAGPPAEEDLSSYDVVFLRYHPHREGAGTAGNPAIEFGVRLRQAGVMVVNDPEGTQRAGGRMYLSGLPPEIRPRTLITREPGKVKAFLKALDAPAVLKPLDERAAGVDNVFYVAPGHAKNLNQIITVVRKTGYVVVQEYLAEVRTGEKRLLLLAGDPIREGERVAIYRRVTGASEDDPLPRRTGETETRRQCDFGPGEARVVVLLRPKLLSDGLYLVGVDLAGSKVLEVNVYTPGGIHPNHELYGLDVGDLVLRDLERRIDVSARA